MDYEIYLDLKLPRNFAHDFEALFLQQNIRLAMVMGQNQGALVNIQCWPFEKTTNLVIFRCSFIFHGSKDCRA